MYVFFLGVGPYTHSLDSEWLWNIFLSLKNQTKHFDVFLQETILSERQELKLTDYHASLLHKVSKMCLINGYFKETMNKSVDTNESHVVM